MGTGCAADTSGRQVLWHVAVVSAAVHVCVAHPVTDALEVIQCDVEASSTGHGNQVQDSVGGSTCTTHSRHIRQTLQQRDLPQAIHTMTHTGATRANDSARA
jgi:hypothetical protein